MSRVPRWGRFLAPLFVLLWAYVLMATYLIKLVPLYSGFMPKSWRELPGWYWNHWSELNGMLGTISPASPLAIWSGIAISVVLCLVLAFRIALNRPLLNADGR
jgi:hypothetical protein